MPRRLRWAVELLEVGPGDRVLEVGCTMDARQGERVSMTVTAALAEAGFGPSTWTGTPPTLFAVSGTAPARPPRPV